MAVKKGVNKNLAKIILLIAILGGFAIVFVVVTLPSLGIDLFSGLGSSGVKTNTTKNTSSAPVVKAPLVKTVNKTFLQISVASLATPTDAGVDEMRIRHDLFEPFLINISDEELFSKMMTKTDDQIQLLSRVKFISSFMVKDEKIAWIKSDLYKNKIFEMGVNSVIPGEREMQVLYIDQSGILIYQYPDLSRTDSENIPKLFKVMSKPYQDLRKLESEIIAGEKN